MMKFFYSRSMVITYALLLGPFQKIAAVTELGAFGTVDYELTHGFPTTIRIKFDSDFPAKADSGSASTGDVYFDYTMSGSGMALYVGNDADGLTVNSAGPGTNLEFQLGLTKTAAIPTIGVYEVTAAIDMYYVNTVGDMLMHEQTYTITINLSGTEVQYSLDTSGSANAFTETTDTGATNSDTVQSSDPGDLSLTQPGGAVGFGTDIALLAKTADTGYKVWLDIGVKVEVFSDNSYLPGAKVYEWPANLVSAHVTEGSTTNELTVTLQSVPIAIYNMGTIYVQLGIKYRDASGGRRTLRSLAALPSSGRGLERKETASATLSGEVKFAPADKASGVLVAKSLLATTATAMAGTILLV